MGSVLNPQVAQELGSEDRQQAQLAQQIGLMGLQQRMQENTPEYQAKVEALKNEKLFREEVSAAGGDMTKVAGAAVKYGKPELAVNIYNQAEARAARVQQANQAYELKVMELTQRAEDKAADRETRALAAAQLLELKKQGMALQAEIARGNQELKKLQFTMKADQGLQTQVTKLGAALEKANLPQTDVVLGQVEDALGKEPAKAKHLASYIAGENSWKLDLAVDQDVRVARQAVHKLFNITLKDRSGAAVTNQELERLKQEFATGVWKRPEQLLNGLEKARKIINNHYASVSAGFGPEALKAYNENIRGFGGRVVLEGGKVDDPLGIR
jgi:hypothetical protein